MESEEELLINGDAVVSVLVCVLFQVKFDAVIDSVSVNVEIKSNDRVGSLASAKTQNRRISMSSTGMWEVNVRMTVRYRKVTKL